MSMQGIATTITQRQLQEAPVQPQHRVGIFGGTLYDGLCNCIFEWCTGGFAG